MMFRLISKAIFALMAWELKRIAEKEIPNRSKDYKAFKKQQRQHKACEDTFRRMREENIKAMNVIPRDPNKLRKSLDELMGTGDG
jgi:hypothetical protein